jgi:hypothetical protein
MIDGRGDHLIVCQGKINLIKNRHLMRFLYCENCDKKTGYKRNYLENLFGSMCDLWPLVAGHALLFSKVYRLRQ